MSATIISPLSKRPISLDRSLSAHLLLRHGANRSTSIKLSSTDDIISGPIREVFLKHAAHHTLCLYLQHRHHTVDAGQAVVKVEGTAHLMAAQAMEDIISFGNKIVPSTWMAMGDTVLPMEFAVAPTRYVCVFLFEAAFLFVSDRS